MRQRVTELLDQAQRLLVLSHRDPDGDALGASLGLMHLLGRRGKQVSVYSAGPIPEEYQFLPGLERVSGELPPAGELDLAVLLDCHQPRRTGEAAGEFLEDFQRAVVVDHHQGEADYGLAAWVEPAYAATSQMLEELADRAGWELDAKAATCLFAGVMTDTGSFRYGNASAEVFRCAARLVEAGASPWQISQQVYATRPRRLALLGRILERLEYHAGGRLVVGKVSLADLEAVGGDSRDLEDAVEALRGIPGVEVAVLLRQRPEGGVKASLRSRGEFDVARLALEEGGGGHKNAAGFMSREELEPLARRLVRRLAAELEGGA